MNQECERRIVELTKELRDAQDKAYWAVEKHQRTLDKFAEKVVEVSDLRAKVETLQQEVEEQTRIPQCHVGVVQTRDGQGGSGRVGAERTETVMGQLGEPKREIYVEPLEIPVPTREAEPAPSVPESRPEPEQVPA